jgi:hypothetical protein
MVDEIGERIEHIKALIREVEQDPDRISGVVVSIELKDLLGEPHTEEEVSAYERQHGVRLPEDFRRFLLELGGKLYPNPDLAKPFPLTKAWNEEETEEENETPYTKSEILGTFHSHGSIYVAHYGCGVEWRYIVTGAARGQMWLIDAVNDNAAGPCAPEYDFLRWYELFLECECDVEGRDFYEIIFGEEEEE